MGTGWNNFVALCGGPDGTIYGTHPDGTMFWYRHYGHDQGYGIWHGPLRVGAGWQPYRQVFAVGNGFVYGIDDLGDLYLWRHHGFLVGDGPGPTRSGWATGRTHDAIPSAFAT